MNPFIFNILGRVILCSADNKDIAIEIIYQYFDGNVPKQIIKISTKELKVLKNRVCFDQAK